MPSLYLWLWLCISVFLSFSSKAVDCSTDTIGLCTPTVEEIIDEVITETTEHGADGITITTTTETTTTTTTVTNEDSLDLLDGNNDYVTTSKEGDMDYDWGGIGSASMPTGTYCNELGTDRCAEITDPNLTTFVQTVDISKLNIEYGGRTNYTIKVDKQDSQDSIYMKIIGKDGSVNVFSGTDVLSASGVASGYQAYEGGFDFSGSLTTLIIEVGGRDINLSVGVLFDDVTVNVLYNVINTIITQSITSVEMFIALNIDAPPEVIDVVEDVFESNDAINTDEGFILEPIEIEEPTYETVELEIEEIEVAEIEVEVEAEIEAEIETVEEITPEVEETTEEVVETKEQPKPETKETKKETTKQKAVKKIMKKIDDKQRYDSTSQMKTLIVMQVLGNTKNFFDSQKQLNDRAGFFTDATLPDSVINENNLASYYLFAGSEGLMNDMIDSQWQTTSE